MIKMILTILILFLLLLVLWILSIRPNAINEERRKKMEPFEQVYIAHRGLFSNKGEKPSAPENSLAAFRLAVEHGYGIELDIQLSSDGQLIVFHDATLKRMCSVRKKVVDCSYEELKSYSLLGSDQHIPLFQEVLDIVDGRVPMIVEVKPEGDCCKTAASLKEHMENYHDIYCMESFHPKAVRWYRKNCPDIIRGQLSERFPRKKKTIENLVQIFLKNLMLNFLARPDFIAYNHHHKNVWSYRLCRKLYPVFNVAWTIRSQEELKAASDVFTVFIFDGFIPEEKKDVFS